MRWSGVKCGIVSRSERESSVSYTHQADQDGLTGVLIVNDCARAPVIATKAVKRTLNSMLTWLFLIVEGVLVIRGRAGCAMQ